MSWLAKVAHLLRGSNKLHFNVRLTQRLLVYFLCGCRCENVHRLDGVPTPEGSAAMVQEQ